VAQKRNGESINVGGEREREREVLQLIGEDAIFLNPDIVWCEMAGIERGGGGIVVKCPVRTAQ
jgi:hypothetical protein